MNQRDVLETTAEWGLSAPVGLANWNTVSRYMLRGVYKKSKLATDGDFDE